MSTPEIVLWVLTAVIIVVMVRRSWDLAVTGLKWWIHPSMSLVLRIPVLLVAAWCMFGGIELVYDVNALAWFSSDPSDGLSFRWWLLLLTPIVLSVASLGFTIPYLGYLVLIPAIQKRASMAAPTRIVLSTLVAIVIPGLLFGIQKAI